MDCCVERGCGRVWMLHGVKKKVDDNENQWMELIRGKLWTLGGETS